MLLIRGAVAQLCDRSMKDDGEDVKKPTRSSRSLLGRLFHTSAVRPSPPERPLRGVLTVTASLFQKT